MTNLSELTKINRVVMSTSLIPFSSDKAFMLKCKGEGMMPYIGKNAQCVCEETDKFENGDFVIVFEEKGKCSMWSANKKKGEIILNKTNPSFFHKTKSISAAQLNIIGVVRTIINYPPKFNK